MTAGLCLYFYNDYCLIPVIFLFTVSWVQRLFRGKAGVGLRGWETGIILERGVVGVGVGMGFLFSGSFFSFSS